MPEFAMTALTNGDVFATSAAAAAARDSLDPISQTIGIIEWFVLKDDSKCVDSGPIERTGSFGGNFINGVLPATENIDLGSPVGTKCICHHLTDS